MAIPVGAVIKGAKVAGNGLLALVNKIGVKDELVQLGASLSQKGVEAGWKAHAKRVEEKANLIEIPEIQSKNYSIKLDDAKRWLEEDGLRAEAVIVKPDSSYKDKTEFDVVGTNYRLKQKVKPGTRIILQYVNKEVIDESQKLFEEEEKQKAEKAAKQAERNSQNRQKFDETVNHAKGGASGAVSGVQKGFNGLISNFRKKDKAELAEKYNSEEK